MFLKIHHSQQGGDIVAVCDRELLNTTVLHGDIEVPIKESFYGNCLASEDEVREALLHAYNANLIGERAVALAIDMGLITRSGCILIGAIPHALLFRV